MSPSESSQCAVSTKCFPSKHFIRSSISLQEQKRAAPNAKLVCLDACHLSGKLKGMLICATNQDYVGTMFIFAHDLVPREDEESWRNILRHF